MGGGSTIWTATKDLSKYNIKAALAFAPAVPSFL